MQHETMRTTGSREMYSNAWMSVREDSIVRADGSPGIYGVVDKPEYALVIPLLGDQLLLVEQYRYPLEARRWEFPQGTAPDRVECGVEELAARELREETGLRAATLIDLGRLDVAPGMTSQRGRAFLATELTVGEPAREPEEQDMQMSWFSREEFERMVAEGELTDSQSLAAYLRFLLYERAVSGDERVS